MSRTITQKTMKKKARELCMDITLSGNRMAVTFAAVDFDPEMKPAEGDHHYLIRVWNLGWWRMKSKDKYSPHEEAMMLCASGDDAPYICEIMRYSAKLAQWISIVRSR